MQIIEFENQDEWLKLRTEDITSTEVSALFGLNPWKTEFELWHEKKEQQVIKLEENERMSWGKALEEAIAKKFAEKNGWDIEPFKDYARIPELRLGSSFDYRIKDQESFKLLEIKNVDGLQFKNKWELDDDGKVNEAPPHIELQVQHQFAVTEWNDGYIGALVAGNVGQEIYRKPNPNIINKIKEKVDKFWWSIDNDKPPKPDYERDSEFICELYKDSQEGLVLDGTGSVELEQLVYDYQLAGVKEREYGKLKKAKKAEIIELIGGAEKVRGDGWTISAKTTKESYVEAFTRKAFRGFRVTFKKQK